MLNIFSNNYFWWLAKLSITFIIPAIVFDFEILFLIQSLVLIHGKFGLESIINDYVHSVIIKLTYLIFLRILVLEILLYFIEFTL